VRWDGTSLAVAWSSVLRLGRFFRGAEEESLCGKRAWGEGKIGLNSGGVCGRLCSALEFTGNSGGGSVGILISTLFFPWEVPRGGG